MSEADQDGASILSGEGKSVRRNGGTIVILTCLCITNEPNMCP